MYNRQYFLLSLSLTFVACLACSSSLFDTPQFAPDEYRYLAQVAQLKSNFSESWIDALTVENSWTKLWWIEGDPKVRFFRPLIIWSYLLDATLYADIYQGAFITNIAIYSLSCLFALLILRLWVGDSVILVFTSVAFAVLPCHSEVLWYVAGRTDSIAGLFSLALIYVHLARPASIIGHLGSAILFFLALAAKENSALIPVALFIYDLGSNGDKHWQITTRSLIKRSLFTRYINYASCIAVYVAIRYALMQGSSWEGESLEPYLFLPFADPYSFLSHLWLSLRAYSNNLVFGTLTLPFLSMAKTDQQGIAGIIVMLLFLIIGSIKINREKVFILALGFLSFLPCAMVYISERYLFIPSFAFVAWMGILLTELSTCNVLILRTLHSYFIYPLLTLWLVFQGLILFVKIDTLSDPQNPPTFSELTKDLFKPERGKPESISIDPEKRLLLINAPLDWLSSQFLQDELRVILNSPSLDVSILSLMPTEDGCGEDITLTAPDSSSIVLKSRAPIMQRDARETSMPWKEFVTGAEYTKAPLDFTAQFITLSLTELKFTFNRPIDHYQIFIYRPSSANECFQGKLEKLLYLSPPTP